MILGLGSMGLGAYLGVKAQKKLAGQIAYMKCNPENEISKIEQDLAREEEEVKKLRSNEDYMKRYRLAKEKYEKGHKEILHLDEEDPHQWEIEARWLDEAKSREIPEGDVEYLEDCVRDRREELRNFRENTRKVRIRAREDAERYEEGKLGMAVGTGLGLIAAGGIASKLSK